MRGGGWASVLIREHTPVSLACTSEADLDAAFDVGDDDCAFAGAAFAEVDLVAVDEAFGEGDEVLKF
jgi:hypothetical protein